MASRQTDRQQLGRLWFNNCLLHYWLCLKFSLLAPWLLSHDRFRPKKWWAVTFATTTRRRRVGQSAAAGPTFLTSTVESASRSIAPSKSSSRSRLSIWGQCYKTFFVCDLQFFVLSSSVSQTRPEKLTNDKHWSLLQKSVIYGQKKFYNIGPWSQCYKTFFCCDLRFFVKSFSVCPWQTFQA